ncbi:hypothetical protein AMTR_s00031p00211310 [Amborella trichopoda]|uniref:Secreted protein n=1 Tax=Amborella trichopoda TaxID=13333 RepID=U5D2E3_AMBTC|nr:hypothetical protein AMTR_s00031p00211310 [Amborella trichopoda]
MAGTWRWLRWMTVAIAARWMEQLQLLVERGGCNRKWQTEENESCESTWSSKLAVIAVKDGGEKGKELQQQRGCD